jgi:murein L,D-transpeptidase YcbB/YkuD
MLVARLFFFQGAIFLLCLSSSVISQADSAWQKESTRYLEQLLNRNRDLLRELKYPDFLEFYRARNYLPLWSNQEGRLDRAYDLLHVIVRAEDEGLEPADYYLEELTRYWDSTVPVESVQLDLLLSAALYRYSNDVYMGRLDEYYLDTAWHIKTAPWI